MTTMISNGNGKRKRKARKNGGEDIISQMPNDILISIISRLPLREATATNTLSTRWRYLSTYTASLNFEFPPFETKSHYSDRDLEDMLRRSFQRYMNTIDHVLDSHKGGRVKEFRVRTYCFKGMNIDKWLEFALAKGVEILDIDMIFLWGKIDKDVQYSLQLVNLMRRIPSSSSALKCLKQCSLSGIHVGDVDIKLLQSNSHLLESLSIKYSRTLRNVSIVGRSLRHLLISSAWNLESIEIDNAVELVSLKCYFLPATYSLKLNNVPKLTELSTDESMGLTLLEHLLRMPASIRDQLQTLELRVDLPYARAYVRTLLPELMSMKHLELHTVLFKDDKFLLRVIYIIQACPSLETLHIKLSWSYVPDIKLNVYGEGMRLSGHVRVKKLSSNLKKMKISGFVGTSAELGVVFYVIKNGDSLEELIVEACDQTKTVKTLATYSANRHFRQFNSLRLQVI